MQTLVSLYLPAWPVELARLREHRSEAGPASDGSSPDVAVLLSRIAAGRELVAARCSIARAAGVRVGMTIAEARALLPPGIEPVLREYSAMKDAAALRRLAHWALRFTPLVATDPPDGLLLDVTASLRLFGGADRLLRRLIRGVRGLGFSCRAAAAPTFGAAWALARFASFQGSAVRDAGRGRDRHEDAAGPAPDLFSTQMPAASIRRVHVRAAILEAAVKADVAGVLAPLPIAALRVERDTIDALEEVGVLTIGQLIALPRRSLPSRFGPLLTLRLQQALGDRDERIEPVRPVEQVRASIVFDGPTTDTAAVSLCVRTLLDRCALQMRRRALGARRIELRIGRSDLEPVVLDVALSMPSDSAAHLWTLLRPRVESVNMGFGIEEIGAHITRLARIPEVQPSLPVLPRPGDAADAGVRTSGGSGGGGWGERAAGELVDALAARLGASRVIRMESAQSHLPERVFGPASAVDADPAAIRGDAVLMRESDGMTLSPRPTRLIEPPRAVRVIALAPDGPPATARIDREDVRIVSAIGPERLGEEWWRAQHGAAADPLRARDYYRVQDDRGRWLWIFRQVPGGRWWLHGSWD